MSIEADRLRLFTACLDYLVNHLPALAFDTDFSDFTIKVTAPGVDQPLNVAFEYDGTSHDYRLDGRDYFTPADLLLALANRTGSNILFTGSVVEEMQALIPPFADYPFKIRRKTGTVSETCLYFAPDSQLRLAPSFTRYQVNQGLLHNHKHSLDLSVHAALLERLSQLTGSLGAPHSVHLQYALTRKLPEVKHHD